MILARVRHLEPQEYDFSVKFGPVLFLANDATFNVRGMALFQKFDRFSTKIILWGVMHCLSFFFTGGDFSCLLPFGGRRFPAVRYDRYGRFVDPQNFPL